MTLKRKSFEKKWKTRRKCWWTAFSPFPHNVFYSFQKEFLFLSLFILSSASTLNLVKPKNYCLGYPFSNKPWFLHVCSTNLLKTAGKGEIVCHEQFLLFPLCFLPAWRTFWHFPQIWNCRLQTLSFQKSLKFVVWEWFKSETTPQTESLGNTVGKGKAFSPFLRLLLSNSSTVSKRQITILATFDF